MVFLQIFVIWKNSFAHPVSLDNFNQKTTRSYRNFIGKNNMAQPTKKVFETKGQTRENFRVLKP